MRLTCTRLILTTFLSGLACTASAQTYLGVGLGTTDVDYLDDDATSLTIYGGFFVVPNVALQIGYVDLGEFGLPRTSDVLAINGFDISAKAVLPLSSSLDLYARLGVFFWEEEARRNSISAQLDEGEDLTYGGGITWHAAQGFEFSLELQQYDFPESEARNVSIGARFSF